MTFHKTILTLLAAMLAVIGTTGTVIHAQGNDSEPTPGNYLNATQLIDFNSLDEEVREGLTEDFLPDLASQDGFSEQGKKDFFAAVVSMEKNAPPLNNHVHARDETENHSHCSDPPRVIIHVEQQVGVFSSARCNRNILAFHSWSRLFSNPGYAYQSRKYRNATYAYSWVFDEYRPRNNYKYCGGFSAHVLDNPTPTPRRKEVCYPYRT